jgi:hypothetical protein
MNKLLLHPGVNYMANKAPSQEYYFVEVGWSFHGLLICSRVFLTPKWMMVEKVLGDVASWCWPYLVAKSSHTGVDVDGIACPMHNPMACSR